MKRDDPVERPVSVKAVCEWHSIVGTHRTCREQGQPRTDEPQKGETAESTMRWRITQEGPHQWTVYRGDEKHWAQTAADAVALMVALEAEGR